MIRLKGWKTRYRLYRVLKVNRRRAVWFALTSQAEDLGMWTVRTVSFGLTPNHEAVK